MSEAIFKAEQSYLHDYWFTEEGIYRVDIVKNRYVMLALLGTYLIAGFILGLLAYLFQSQSLVQIEGILVIAPVVVAYLYLLQTARTRRLRYGSPPLKTILEDTRISNKMQWDEVKGVSIARKRNVRILFGIHVYRGTIENRDYESLKNFLTSKLGNKLSVREGALR